MIAYIKYLVKRYFYFLILRDKYTASAQLDQYALGIELKKMPFRFSEIEFNVFTYHGEDGLLFNIFSRLNETPKIFVDIGVGDCVKSNCANLAVNLGWTGLFIDAEYRNIAIGKSFYAKLNATKFSPPHFLQKKVSPENINELLKETAIFGEIGLLSIDIDGDDYWIWKAIDTINPIVVIIECKVEFGDKELITPYSKTTNNYKNATYLGASIPSFCRLAKQKGYSLVSANRSGYNLIFLKNTFLESSNISELNPQDLLALPQVKKSFYADSLLKGIEFVKDTFTS
jgi:hypothetical protein